MRRLLMRRSWAIAVALACAAGCDSPTLPLPPPSAPSVSQASTANRYTLHSDKGAEPNAVVVIYNHDPNVSLQDRVAGVQADGEGTWDQTITAFPGDVIDVWQEFGSTRSAQATFQIPQK